MWCDTGNGNDGNHDRCTRGCHTCHGNRSKPCQVGRCGVTPGTEMTEIMTGAPADVTPVTEIAANHARWADVV